MGSLSLQASSDFHNRSLEIKDIVIRKLIQKAQQDSVQTKESAVVKAYFLAEDGVKMLDQELKREFSSHEYDDLRTLFINSISRYFFSPDDIGGELEKAFLTKER